MYAAYTCAWTYYTHTFTHTHIIYIYMYCSTLIDLVGVDCFVWAHPSNLNTCHELYSGLPHDSISSGPVEGNLCRKPRSLPADIARFCRNIFNILPNRQFQDGYCTSCYNMWLCPNIGYPKVRWCPLCSLLDCIIRVYTFLRDTHIHFSLIKYRFFLVSSKWG